MKKILSLILVLVMLFSLAPMSFAVDCEHNNKTLVNEVPVSETTHGVKEHYECDDCVALFGEDGTTEVTAADLVIHNYVHKDEVAATMQSDGVKEHYECSCTGCGLKFTKSGDVYTQVTDAELVIPSPNILNSKNFPDANFLAALQAIYPTGLTASAAAEEWFLDVENKGIASLKGIDFFTNLSTLYCGGNKISSLDLSGNTALVNIWDRVWDQRTLEEYAAKQLISATAITDGDTSYIEFNKIVKPEDFTKVSFVQLEGRTKSHTILDNGRVYLNSEDKNVIEYEFNTGNPDYKLYVYVNCSGSSSTQVTFQKAGGSGGTNSVIAEYGKILPSIVAPNYPYHIFQGYWTNSSVGRAYYYRDGEPCTLCWDNPVQDVTLYAHWLEAPYVIELMNDDDTVYSTIYGAMDVFPDKITPPQKEGYIFVGYFSEKDGKGTQYYDNEGYPLIGWDKASDGRLYPLFVEKDNKVIIKNNNKDFGNVRYWKYDGTTYGEIFDLPEDGVITYDAENECIVLSCEPKEGYITEVTSDGFSDVGYDDGEQLSVFIPILKKNSIVNVNFIATSDLYTITLINVNPQYGACYCLAVYGVLDSSIEHQITIKNLIGNEPISIGAEPNSGYSAMIYTDNEKLASSDESFEYIIPESVIKKKSTIKTSFTKFETFDITFEANGGKLNDEKEKTRTVTYKSTYGTLPNATRSGYYFKGWYTAREGGTQIYATTLVTTSETRTFYAHWEPITKYNITYYDKDGAEYSGSNSSSLVKYHVPGEKTTLVEGTKAGYTFDGWYKEKDCSGTKISEFGEYDLKDDISLYANWIKTYNITMYIVSSSSSTSSSGGTASFKIDGGDAVSITTAAVSKSGLTGAEEIVITVKPSSTYYAKIYTDTKALKSTAKGTETSYTVPADLLKENPTIKISFSTNPYTGDDFDPMLWVIAMASAAAGAAITITKKKARK